MRTHKAYVIQEPFGIDALALVERPSLERSGAEKRAWPR